MIAKLTDKIEREISNLKVENLKADILLGVQRGVDVHISFTTVEKMRTLHNMRTIHFKGSHSSIWNKEKALLQIKEFIESGNKLISNQKYIEEEI